MFGFKKNTASASGGTIARFARREEGTATVEAVLWLPMLLSILVIMLDTSMLFNNRTQALRLMQDANRSFALGRLNEAETEEFLRSRLRQISPSATVDTQVDAGVITTRVTMRANEMDLVGLFRPFANLTIGLHAEHLAEN